MVLLSKNRLIGEPQVQRKLSFTKSTNNWDQRMSTSTEHDSRSDLCSSSFFRQVGFHLVPNSHSRDVPVEKTECWCHSRQVQKSAINNLVSIDSIAFYSYSRAFSFITLIILSPLLLSDLSFSLLSVLTGYCQCMPSDGFIRPAVPEWHSNCATSRERWIVPVDILIRCSDKIKKETTVKKCDLMMEWIKIKIKINEWMEVAYRSDILVSGLILSPIILASL
jgi:hypothetical protein